MLAWLLVGPHALPSSPPARTHAPRRHRVAMFASQEQPNCFRRQGTLRVEMVAPEVPREFRSRSTARVEEEAFAEGTEDRRNRLHAALEVVGVDVAELTESADLEGSSALRLYSSFVNPKNAGALATHAHALTGPGDRGVVFHGPLLGRGCWAVGLAANLCVACTLAQHRAAHSIAQRTQRSTAHHTAHHTVHRTVHRTVHQIAHHTVHHIAHHTVHAPHSPQR